MNSVDAFCDSNCRIQVIKHHLPDKQNNRFNYPENANRMRKKMANLERIKFMLKFLSDIGDLNKQLMDYGGHSENISVYFF